MNSRICLVLVCLALFVAGTASAADLFTIFPYIGQLRDVQNNSMVPIAGNGLMEGIAFQGSNDRYQCDASLYKSSETDRNIWGGTINGDLFFFRSSFGSWVAGAGTMYLSSSLSSAIAPFSTLSMENHALVSHCLGGYRFSFAAGVAECSFLPWIGIEGENVWGSASGWIPGIGIALAQGRPFAGAYDPGTVPIGGLAIDTSYSQSDLFAAWGLNIQARLLHMVELGANYHCAWNNARFQNNAAITVAYLFLLGRLGVTYRYEYLETTAGSDRFNMVGLSIRF